MAWIEVETKQTKQNRLLWLILTQRILPVFLRVGYQCVRICNMHKKMHYHQWCAIVHHTTWVLWVDLSPLFRFRGWFPKNVSHDCGWNLSYTCHDSSDFSELKSTDFLYASWCPLEWWVDQRKCIQNPPLFSQVNLNLFSPFFLCSSFFLPIGPGAIDVTSPHHINQHLSPPIAWLPAEGLICWGAPRRVFRVEQWLVLFAWLPPFTCVFSANPGNHQDELLLNWDEPVQPSFQSTTSMFFDG